MRPTRDILPPRKTFVSRLVSERRGRISVVLSTRHPAPHARESSKVSEFKRLDEAARQRSDCCSSGTSSYQSEASASAGGRAGAIGGPVVGRPRWPRILSITGLSLLKAMTLRRPPQGQARMSSRKTRRSSSLQGLRESRGRGGLVVGGGRDVSGALLEHGASAGHALCGGAGAISL